MVLHKLVQATKNIYLLGKNNILDLSNDYRQGFWGEMYDKELTKQHEELREYIFDNLNVYTYEDEFDIGIGSSTEYQSENDIYSQENE